MRFGISMCLVLCLSAILLLLGFSTAAAHSVKVFAFEEGGKIYGEGYFADGSKVRDSTVEVFNREGTKLLETRTDGNGEFQFSSPGKTDLVIVLTASMGHRAEFVLPRVTPGKPADDGMAAERKIVPDPIVPGKETPVPGISEERFRTIVNEVFDARMKPLVDALLSMKKEGPSLIEIVGGIGYIVGLFGVVFFLKGRKEKNPHVR